MYFLVDQQPEFVLINKEANVSFHREAGNQWLLESLRKALSFDHLFAVHRLDKITSGLLLFAKNKEVAQELNTQFAEGRIEKYYLAISDCDPKKKQGVIRGDMIRSRRGTWKLARTNTNPARTRFVSFSLSPGLRLFVLKPLTGKTHQLRVALKSISAPVLGDNRYHPKERNKRKPDRGYLHAYFLRFSLAGQSFQYLCPPDSGELFLTQQFADRLSQLQEPWGLFP